MTKTEIRLSRLVQAAIILSKLDVKAGRTSSAEKRLNEAYAKVDGTSRGLRPVYAGEFLAILDNFAFVNDLLIMKNGH
jgi:hypothetical protein